MKRIERHRAILGVDEKATLSDLKKVYRKIMMEWHPDKFHDSDEAKKMVRKIGKINCVLSFFSECAY